MTISTERSICPTVQHPVTARATPKRAINRSRTHKKSPVSSAFVRFGVGDEAGVGGRLGCFLSNYRSPARLTFTLRRPQSAAQITRNRLRIYLDSESNRMAGQADSQADSESEGQAYWTGKAGGKNLNKPVVSAKNTNTYVCETDTETI